MKDSVVLLGNGILNLSLPAVKIIEALFHIIRLVSFSHNRLALHHSGGIRQTGGEYGGIVHVIGHEIGSDFQIPVSHGDVPIIIYDLPASTEILDYGIPGGRERRCIHTSRRRDR